MRTFIFILTMLAVCGVPCAVAVAGDEFDHVIVLADGERASYGHVALDSSQPGKVDIAWRDKDAAVRYSQWDRAKLAENDGLVVDDEAVCGLTHMLLGIRRHEDSLHIGANNSKHLNQWTRQADGTWVSRDSGVLVAGYAGATADWDLNPKTGRGAFVGITASPGDVEGEVNYQRVYVEEKEGGTWDTRTLDERHQGNTRAAMTFTRTGTPIVAYQVLEKDNEKIIAGAVSVPRTAVAQAYAWFPLDIDADARSTLHLLVVLHTGQTNYYRMKPGDKGWLGPATIVAAGHYGDAAYTSIAVNAKGTKIAALIQDKEGKLQLALTDQQAEQWTLTPLPGGAAQKADVTFGPAGELYVVYYDADAAELKLMIKRE